MFDVVDDGGQDSLIDRGDPVGEFLGGHSGKVPDGSADRNIDVRKNILRVSVKWKGHRQSK